jgi:hypothetical protein
VAEEWNSCAPEHLIEVELGGVMTRFTVQTGGGIDWWMAERLGIRTAIQYRRLFLDAEDSGAKNQIALTAGVTLRLFSP